MLEMATETDTLDTAENSARNSCRLCSADNPDSPAVAAGDDVQPKLDLGCFGEGECFSIKTLSIGVRRRNSGG